MPTAKPKKKATKAPKRLLPTNVRLDDEMLAELREHAAQEDRPVANLIYRIVRIWLDQNRSKLRGGA